MKRDGCGAVGVSVVCVVCGHRKQPRGRSAPAFGEPMCYYDCPGYTEPPEADALWPGETCEEFGFHCLRSPRVTVQDMDRLYGTPCEQIRHAAEMDDAALVLTKILSIAEGDEGDAMDADDAFNEIARIARGWLEKRVGEKQ